MESDLQVTMESDSHVTLEDGFDNFERAFNAWNVARARIRADDGAGAVHILVSISAAERQTGRVTDEDVHTRAVQLRDALVKSHREAARGARGVETIRRRWNDPLPD